MKDEVIFQIRQTYYSRFLPLTFVHRSYSFRETPHRYSPDSLSEVRNKFRDVSVRTLSDLEKLSREDLSKFHAQVAEYIHERQIVDAIRKPLRTHHRLVVRADVIEQSLDIYTDGKHALFCNVAPLQIEGLVGDWACELGVPERDLLTAPLTRKVDLIGKADNMFRDYEYFRYRFPVLRNQVAHGRFHSTNPTQVANLLLLDLADVCDRLRDEELPANKLVALLRSLDTATPDFSTMFEYAQYRNLELSTIYNLNGKQAQADALFSDNGFWHWLDEQVEPQDPQFLTAAKNVTLNLKNAGLGGDSTTTILKKIAKMTR